MTAGRRMALVVRERALMMPRLAEKGTLKRLMKRKKRVKTPTCSRLSRRRERR